MHPRTSFEMSDLLGLLFERDASCLVSLSPSLSASDAQERPSVIWVFQLSPWASFVQTLAFVEANNLLQIDKHTSFEMAPLSLVIYKQTSFKMPSLNLVLLNSGFGFQRT